MLRVNDVHSLTCFPNSAASYHCYFDDPVGNRVFWCWTLRDSRHVLDETHFFPPGPSKKRRNEKRRAELILCLSCSVAVKSMRPKKQQRQDWMLPQTGARGFYSPRAMVASDWALAVTPPPPSPCLHVERNAPVAGGTPGWASWQNTLCFGREKERFSLCRACRHLIIS